MNAIEPVLKRYASACFILGAIALFAPQRIPAQDASASPQDKKKIHVSGTILGSTGEPLKKATVRLTLAEPSLDQRPTTYSGSTDDGGKFTIEDVQPGNYTLQATKTGFLANRYGARTPTSPGAIISVPDDMNVEGLEVKLTPQGTVSGHVTNVDGEPVPHASMCLVQRVYQNGKKRLIHSSATADSLGIYTFNNVSPGLYTACAQTMENPPGLEPGMSDMMTYYPGVPYGETAPYFAVGPGEHVEGINIKLLRGRLYSVKGKVTFNGKLVTTPMYIVVTNPPPASGGSWSCQVRDGLFTMIDQSPGPHLMEVLGNGGMSATGLVGKMTFDIVDSNVEVVFPLQQATPVRGVLTAEGKDWQSQISPGGAASGTTSAAQDPTGGASATPAVVPHPPIVLSEIDSDNVRTTGRADETGAFTLTPTMPGSYTLDVSGLPRGAYVKSVHYGSADTSQGVPLGSGGESLEIDISMKGATVTGVLLNEKGEPLSGYVVSAWPSSPNPWSGTHGVKSTMSNQQGTFTITGLAPGKYYVASFEEIDSGLRQFPGFLAKFEGRAESVELTEGSQSTVSVKPVSKEAADVEVAKLP